MERLTRVFAETTHGTKGYEAVNKIKVDTENIHNLSEIITTLGKIEDVLEEFEFTSAEDLRNHLNFQDNMAIWEGKLELKNKIADLEQELAELKQKAIVPKFKVGQEVWVNDWTGQLRIGRIYEVQTNAALHDQQPLITYLVDFYGNYEDDDRENDYYEEKEVFATKEEAEAKLKKLKV